MTSEYFQEFWTEETLQRSMSRTKRSQYLLSVLKDLDVTVHDRMLEIGSGTGRNLTYLFYNGYGNLKGIERNSQAYGYSRQHSPDLIELCHADATTFLFMPNWYDVIFTMATLQHIPKIERLAWSLQKASRKYIIVFEDEMRSGPVHFKRNYKKVFNQGFKQIKHKKLGEAQGFAKKGFRLRVFRKK